MKCVNCGRYFKSKSSTTYCIYCALKLIKENKALEIFLLPGIMSDWFQRNYDLSLEDIKKIIIAEML